ncbi:hypothetical protein ACFP2T_11430 [Plantactinospora solaniradicis]|uniref:Uncharacterized protein n=1 Tax=Plantactinospora solaniradicis TaxID=1723736 RepID=A0ABW1K5S5_9ACTN
MRRSLLFVVSLVMAAGCFAGGGASVDWADLSRSSLVGVWQADRRGDVIEFTDAGDFYAEDVGYMFTGFSDVLPSGFDVRRDKAPGSGQWSIGKPLGYPTGPDSLVDLYFDVLAKKPTAGGNNLEAQRSDSGIVLVHYIGDPDVGNTISYHRCQTGCRHIAPARKPLGTRREVTAKQFVGVWRDKTRNSKIVFDPDGTFHGDDFAQLFGANRFVLPAGFDPTRQRLPGAGTWTLVRSRWDPTGPVSDVHLRFTILLGRRASEGSRPMPIYTAGSTLVLVNYSSDPSVNPQRRYSKPL